VYPTLQDQKYGDQTLSVLQITFGGAKVSQAQVFEWSYCFKEGQMFTIVTNILGTLQPIETVSSMTRQRGLTNCELAKLRISINVKPKSWICWCCSLFVPHQLTE